MTPNIASFFHWWFSELATFVPGRATRAANASSKTALVIWGDADFEIRDSKGGDSRFDTWSEVTSALKSSIVSGDSIIVALPQNAVLIRSVDLPTKSLPKADQILSLDLERATPFSRDQVYSAWRRTGSETHGNTTSVRHFVVAKTDIDQELKGIRELGISISALRLIDDDNAFLDVDLLAAEPIVPRRLDRVFNSAVVATLCTVLILSAVAIGQSFWRQQKALDTLLAASMDASRRAVMVREKITVASQRAKTIQGLYDRKADTLPVYWVWEEVTRILPDTAWLREMRIENRRVYLSGYARSASELIARLEASPFFSGVSFVAPVVNSQRPKAEQFSLQMQIAERKS